MLSKETIRMFLRKKAYSTFLYIGARQDGELTYQADIARELRIPITTLNYWITKFKGEGLIDKRLKLTPKGIAVFTFLWENVGNRRLRAHNIQIKFHLEKCPSKFPGCFSKSIYRPLGNKRYRGIMTQLQGMTVMFYSPKKIICVLPNIYADNDEEISSTIQIMVPKIKLILENEFEGVKIGNYELARIQSMHIAILDSVIARAYSLTGFTKEGPDFTLDCSHGTPEVELTNPVRALSDIMDLVSLEEGVRSYLESKQDASKVLENPTNPTLN